MRQLFVLGLSLVLVAATSIAAPPPDSTYVVPSPNDEKIAPPTHPVDIKESPLFLDSKNLERSEREVHGDPRIYYHLPLRPSATISLSRNYNFTDDTNQGWLGVHVAPQVEATWRWQVGVDFHSQQGWLSAAYHRLVQRTLSRFYWGGGVSLLMASKDQLRPFLRFDNYYAMGVAGWEHQVLELQNIRVEVSIHQSSKDTIAKVMIGYTFLL